MEKIRDGDNTKRSIVSALVVVVAVMACVTWFSAPRSNWYERAETIPLYLRNTLRPEPQVLTPFALTDHIGRVFNVERLKGKWTFMFFGYTACPDVCPTTLTVMNRIATGLARRPSDNASQFVFVSVDPEHDDPASMGGYVKHFNPSFVGVTGTRAQLRMLTEQLNVSVSRTKGAASTDYQIAHTSSIMLIDPRGRLYASFAPPVEADEITRQFGAIRVFYMHEENR